MDVSVIIINYNTLALTQACIDSIFEQTEGVSFEVILVDNASTDGSAEHFAADARITFIPSAENLGFGRANNLGYTHSHGRYVFLLNSDTLLRNNALLLFVEQMDSLPERVGCVGAMLLDGEERIARSYLLLPTIANSLQCFICTRFLPESGFEVKDAEKPFAVEGVSGADMFIRRSVIEQCGLFDPDFFMYYEETEMQHRFRRQGFDILIVHGPRILHLEGGSQTSFPNMRKRLLSLRSVLLYHRKTESALRFQLFRALLFLGSLPILTRRKYTLAERMEYLRAILAG